MPIQNITQHQPIIVYENYTEYVNNDVYNSCRELSLSKSKYSFGQVLQIAINFKSYLIVETCVDKDNIGTYYIKHNDKRTYECTKEKLDDNIENNIEYQNKTSYLIKYKTLQIPTWNHDDTNINNNSNYDDWGERRMRLR
jgi:hypothetical protein